MTEGERKALALTAMAVFLLISWEHAALAQVAPFQQAAEWTSTNIAKPIGYCLVAGIGLLGVMGRIPVGWAASGIGGVTAAVNYQTIAGAMGWG